MRVRHRQSALLADYNEMKRTSNIYDSITVGDFVSAIVSASKGHKNRREVTSALADLDGEAKRLYDAFLNGDCYKMIKYRKLVKVNNNGKVRKIDSPSWETRVYQHLIILKLSPVYYKKDNNNGLNCKPGRGITATVSRWSVLHRLKHIFYDRLDLHWCVVIDQRKCYEHISCKIFRRSLRKIVDDPRFVDFATAFVMVDGKLPIGTPTSPLAHHIVMLGFDIFIKEASAASVRYADDNAVFVSDLREAHEIKWRIKNYWWYELGIRAKRHTVRIVPIERPMDFCGYILHRGGGGHSKGYVGIRRSILQRARKATNRNWGSYFGLLKAADLFGEMKRIETKMKLTALTNTIQLERPLDAPNVPIKDIVGTTITIVDYDLRRSKEGKPDWIKLLIGITEPDGRVRAGEVHGSYQWLAEFIAQAESLFGKESLLPIEDVVIENQCGYIFKDSTNQIKYFNDDIR